MLFSIDLYNLEEEEEEKEEEEAPSLCSASVYSPVTLCACCGNGTTVLRTLS